MHSNAPTLGSCSPFKAIPYAVDINKRMLSYSRPKKEYIMRRWLVLSLVLMLIIGAILLAGCGNGAESILSDEDAEVFEEGVIPAADSTACAANRRTISSAAKSYQAMEGKAPSSIQQLVPGYLQSVPTCPSGGIYTLKGTTVTCSIHGS
jgi:hypothetical protein